MTSSASLPPLLSLLPQLAFSGQSHTFFCRLKCRPLGHSWETAVFPLQMTNLEQEPSTVLKLSPPSQPLYGAPGTSILVSSSWILNEVDSLQSGALPFILPSALLIVFSSGCFSQPHLSLKSSRSSAQIIAPPRPISFIYSVLYLIMSMSSKPTHSCPL